GRAAPGAACGGGGDAYRAVPVSAPVLAGHERPRLPKGGFPPRQGGGAAPPAAGVAGPRGLRQGAGARQG
ncbi:unnamed protein product, partial [Ectocarpus sp. 4 AP-2014]